MLKENRLKGLWLYEHEDKTTWKYLDNQVSNRESDTPKIRWILNPDFAYKHLDPHYPKSTRKQNGK